MMTILLYGALGRQFGRVHKYDVRTAAEAVRAMCVTLAGFRTALRNGGAYRVLAGGAEALTKETLAHPISTKKTLRIVPVISGASRGLGQVLLGGALIGLSLAIPTSIPFIEASLATGISVTAFASAASSAGLLLALGGASKMLFKQPSSQSVEAVQNRPSYAFDGAVNTAAQGNPISVLYGGPLIVGSQVGSAGLSVEQLA